MSRTNALSAMGRMGWSTHFMIYPTIAGLYFGAYKPYAKRQEEASLANDYEILSKAKAVDPDHFNPFTPIPFNNNPELKYVFANIKLRNFTNEHHISNTDYMWRSYHDSYDHGNQRTHKWNWSSM